MDSSKKVFYCSACNAQVDKLKGIKFEYDIFVGYACNWEHMAEIAAMRAPSFFPTLPSSNTGVTFHTGAQK